MKLGIERFDAYPATLRLDLVDLCDHRGIDDSRLMTRARSVNPSWEDPVTMAVNAARLVVDDANRAQIGLLIVATETGVDLEKSISTWVHRYLALPSTTRNFEIKHACYGATAAIQMALAWLRTPAGRGQKALVVTTDQSLIAIGKPWEPICGAGATATLLSDDPALAFEPDKAGVFASEITDVIRPNLSIETGNSDASMFSYLEALEGAYDAYRAVAGDVSLADSFDWHTYHMPFPGLALTAHRALRGIDGQTSRAESTRDYQQRVEPGTRYASEVGGVYSGSWVLGLMSLCDHAQPESGQRVSVFSYGSGSCAEFFGVQVQTATSNRRVGQLIDQRYEIGRETYERLERERAQTAGTAEFAPSVVGLEDAYERLYAGRGRLVLDRVESYFRTYRWS